MKVYKGTFLDIYSEKKSYPNGHLAQVEYIKHPGAVLIIPYVSDKEVLLIKQYRPCIEKEIWEFPAGTLEPGEDPAVCAVRELEEECGYRASRVEYVFSVANCPGYSSELIHVYKAYDLCKTQTSHEQDEQIIVETVSLMQIRQMVENFDIIDAKSLSVLLYVL